MKHFKNEELKTLEQCSDEELLCIVNNLKNGATEIFYTKEWIKAPRELLYLDVVYRVPPKETKVYWDRFPKCLRFLVISDKCFASQVKPASDIKNGYFIPSTGDYSEFDFNLLPALCELGDEELPILIERPEGKEGE